MQNRYVGDVGDFGKYGLLREICAGSDVNLNLGVVWYLVPDESGTADGKYVSYLTASDRSSRTLRVCEPTLYDSLREIVVNRERNVLSVQSHLVLPTDTVYYNTLLSYVREDGKPIPIVERVALRDAWQADALSLTSTCDIVFVDPDNGLEVEVKPHDRKGPKYVFFADLMPYIQRNQSLVVYHHIGRRGSALEQISERTAQIKERLGRDSLAMLYHRGTARAYFIIPSEGHRELLRRRCQELVGGPWSQHFELVTQ